jgi:GTP-binding protein HflX
MQIELDRRHIERRMTVLRRELQKISTNREIQRRQRTRNRLPLVSMVGYTNAGKSTLMNALIDRCEDLHDAPCQKTEPGESFKTDSLQNDQLYLQSDQSHLQNNQLRKKENSRHVFVKDMVFATLDTSVRRIEPAGAQPFLLSDTVGFINDLPTYLVEAFHSTLEEVLKADLILEVVDSSDPEHAMQMEVTDRTLQELGAGSIPRIRVMNKADLTEPSGISLNNDGSQRQDLIRLSAKRGDGIDQLVCMIEEKLNGETAQVSVMIPYHRMGMSETLRKNARVLAEEYTQDGLRMDVRMDIALLRTFRDYIVK